MTWTKGPHFPRLPWPKSPEKLTLASRRHASLTDTTMDQSQRKQEIRERIWHRLREEGQQAFPFKERDFIPNFVGSVAVDTLGRSTRQRPRVRRSGAEPPG